MTTHGADRHGHISRGIQAEKPPGAAGIQAGKSLPPWDQPGRFRLDCEPHRGNLLRWAARASLVLAILSGCLLGLPVLVALPLGLATWLSARRDLTLMRKGLMDPEGLYPTREAWCISLVACVLCCEIGVLILCRLPMLAEVLR